MSPHLLRQVMFNILKAIGQAKNSSEPNLGKKKYSYKNDNIFPEVIFSSEILSKVRQGL